ncbi:MAG: NADH:ubiquinone oxidoreductase [Alphaproteobacteria bacterium]|nr:NADH:ubiquinone oxidoreductase [Alphaproteobacteria bacterium]
MIHYYIELAVWMLIAYFAGCLVGWFAKNLGASPEVAVPAGAAMPAAVKAAAPAPAPAPPVAAPAPAAEPARMERPKGLSAARGGKPDDLQRISGIGPKNESILHNLGFFHFDQIAAWSEREVAWVDDHLRFGGRIQREEWIRQAGLLAAGKEEEFMRDYGTGGLKGKDGQTHSGSHTRKR